MINDDKRTSMDWSDLYLRNILILTIIFLLAINIYALDTFYPIRDIRILDGDSIKCSVVGYKNCIYVEEDIRLYMLDTPENKRVRDKLEKLAGKLVQRFVRDSTKNKKCYIRYIKDGKFGRSVCLVYVEDNDGKLECLNDILINLKLSKSFDGSVAKENWSRNELFDIIKVIDYNLITEGYRRYHKNSK